VIRFNLRPLPMPPRRLCSSREQAFPTRSYPSIRAKASSTCRHFAPSIGWVSLRAARSKYERKPIGDVTLFRSARPHYGGNSASGGPMLQLNPVAPGRSRSRPKIWRAGREARHVTPGRADHGGKPPPYSSRHRVQERQGPNMRTTTNVVARTRYRQGGIYADRVRLTGEAPDQRSDSPGSERLKAGR
jgi:hypothetical protein